MIQLSKAAASEIRRLQVTRQKLDSQLRLEVKTGGCSGFLYTLGFDAATKTGDRVCDSNGVSILVDEQSYNYVRDLTLDYSEDLMGGGFRFHNPNASTTCGCGHSFFMET